MLKDVLLAALAVLGFSGSGQCDDWIVDTGRHGPMISNIFFRKDDTQLVTLSGDRTIRIWSIAENRLERTIFLPGVPTEAALHPNEQLLAVCARTNPADGNKHDLLIVDLDRADRDANPVMRAQPFGNAFTLAYSPEPADPVLYVSEIKSNRIMAFDDNAKEIASHVFTTSDPCFAIRALAIKKGPAGARIGYAGYTQSGKRRYGQLDYTTTVFKNHVFRDESSDDMLWAVAWDKEHLLVTTGKHELKSDAKLIVFDPLNLSVRTIDQLPMAASVPNKIAAGPNGVILAMGNVRYDHLAAPLLLERTAKGYQTARVSDFLETSLGGVSACTASTKPGSTAFAWAGLRLADLHVLIDGKQSTLKIPGSNYTKYYSLRWQDGKLFRDGQQLDIPSKFFTTLGITPRSIALTTDYKVREISQDWCSVTLSNDYRLVGNAFRPTLVHLISKDIKFQPLDFAKGVRDILAFKDNGIFISLSADGALTFWRLDLTVPSMTIIAEGMPFEDKFAYTTTLGGPRLEAGQWNLFERSSPKTLSRREREIATVVPNRSLTTPVLTFLDGSIFPTGIPLRFGLRLVEAGCVVITLNDNIVPVFNEKCSAGSQLITLTLPSRNDGTCSVLMHSEAKAAGGQLLKSPPFSKTFNTVTLGKVYLIDATPRTTPALITDQMPHTAKRLEEIMEKLGRTVVYRHCDNKSAFAQLVNQLTNTINPVIRPSDMVIVLFKGHGEVLGTTVFKMENCLGPNGVDVNACVTIEDVTDTFKKLNDACNSQVIIVGDCCYAEGLFDLTDSSRNPHRNFMYCSEKDQKAFVDTFPTSLNFINARLSGGVTPGETRVIDSKELLEAFLHHSREAVRNKAGQTHPPWGNVVPRHPFIVGVSNVPLIDKSGGLDPREKKPNDPLPMKP